MKRRVYDKKTSSNTSLDKIHFCLMCTGDILVGVITCSSSLHPPACVSPQINGQLQTCTITSTHNRMCTHTWTRQSTFPAGNRLRSAGFQKQERSQQLENFSCGRCCNQFVIEVNRKSFQIQSELNIRIYFFPLWQSLPEL